MQNEFRCSAAILIDSAIHDFDIARFFVEEVAKVLGSIGMLTGPHQTSAWESGCLTTRLSLGERPVLTPEQAANAPLSTMLASRS